MISPMDDRTSLWRSPAVKPLSRKDVADISNSLKFECTEDELDAYTDCIVEEMKSYDRLYHMLEPVVPIQYPRTPGHRPRPEENILNAWYYKCDIKGAATGKLAGKRVGIKDNTAVAGVPMMNGSKILEGYVPEYDATVVTRILDAGGHIAGKTNCDDMCFSSGGFNSSYGPVINPISWRHLPAGSSSGNAVLLAVGEIDLAVGSDQGGSIRLPASNCGIVGLKPTFGLVPYTGSVTMSPCLDHLGPMARTVHDCALLLEVLAGFDNGRDPRQKGEFPNPEYSKQLTKTLDGFRIALIREGFDWTEADVAECVSAAARRLAEIGAKVHDVSIPMHRDGIHIYTPLATEGAYQSIIRDNCHPVGLKGTTFTSLLDKLSEGHMTRSRDFPETFKKTAILGNHMMTSYRGKFYAKAQNLVGVLTSEYNKVLEEYDVIVMPTTTRKPQPVVPSDAPIRHRLSMGLGNSHNSAPFNATGHPSLSICAGHVEGLPVGMMITGKHFDDVTVLKVAYAIEQLLLGVKQST